MIRFLFRFAAVIALAVAVVMTVLDATRSIIASKVVLTPLRDSWSHASAETLSALESAVRNALPAFAWDTVAAAILAAPGFVVFFCLSLLLYAVGHRPARTTNRFAVER